MSRNAQPRIGAHTSIAKGLPNAVAEARRIGCDGFQIFARNPRGWQTRPLDKSTVLEFRRAREQAGLWPLVVHSVYLINLASQDPLLLEKSREAFREEITRSLQLGADYLVVHPGNSKGAQLDRGLHTAVESIRRAARGLRIYGATRPSRRGRSEEVLRILIENTAGQGSSIGSSLQVADLIAALNDLPVGVCLDTAHIFAAGYDISVEKGLRNTIRAIENTFGFNRVEIVHCNDSKVPLGSRVDRHQHIGLGYIGAEAFRRLTHNLKFRRIPFILETPVDKQRGYEWNIKTLRKLAAS